MMGARHLTKRHLAVLGFDHVPNNRHLSSLFGVALSSPKNASQLRGIKETTSRPSRSVRRSESRGPKESRTSIPHPMDSLV